VTDAWNPDQYARFAAERKRPFLDLLALVEPVPGGRAIDLGCGTGELTRELHAHLGARSTIGLDNSETMLAKSAAFAGGGVRFQLGTFLRFAPRSPFDVVFSNAALQWAPDHEKLFERLTAGLAEGGQLAVQMPSADDLPSHQAARAVARMEPFRGELDGYERTDDVHDPLWYAHLLERLGYREQTVRLQVYPQRLESRDGVVEWVRGTLLTAYEERLAPETFARFVDAYRQAVAERYPDDRPLFFPYPRVLLWARR